MNEEERHETLAEARIFALSAPVILPIIEKRKRDALGRLMQAHKSGRIDTASIVAEISAYTDIEVEIKQKELIYRTMEEQQNGPGKSKNTRK